MSSTEYLELLDWTARTVVKGKRGATPKHVPRLFIRLGIAESSWTTLVRDFGRLFSLMAGQPEQIDAYRAKNGPVKHVFRARTAARELLSSV